MTDTLHWPPDKWPRINKTTTLHRCPECRAAIANPDRDAHHQWHENLAMELLDGQTSD